MVDDELERIKMRKMRDLLKLHEEKKYLDKPIVLTDSTFDQIVQKYPIMIIDFWASWCFPCQVLAPVINELAKKYAGKVLFGKLNVDENPKTAARFGILGIPTLLILHNGREVDRIVGAVPKLSIESRLQRYL